MGEHIESMAVLPIEAMLKDADRAIDCAEAAPSTLAVPASDYADLGFHVFA
jgi:hypothetical protein